MTALFPQPLSIRSKKLGILLCDARRSAGKSMLECAQAIGVDQDTYNRYEEGDEAPSLPELEVLAYFLQVPTEYFWGNQTLSASRAQEKSQDLKRVISVRQHTIGAMIRKTRLEIGVSQEDLSLESGIPPESLEAYEWGDAPVPLPVLEVLCSVLNLTINDFRTSQGVIAARETQQRAVQAFLALPLEMQEFIIMPGSQPYLELAQRLSKMPADALRTLIDSMQSFIANLTTVIDQK